MSVFEAMSLERPGVLVLSIVMISVPERKKQFNILRKKVQSQIDYCKKVHPTLGYAEIIPVITPKTIHGGPTIGAKRQMGLDKSGALYVCWLDDDDDVSPDYVETILRLAYKGGDVLTFSSICEFDAYWSLVKMNLIYTKDEQSKPGIVFRRPYHVCAFLRQNLEGIKFPDANLDEDTGFISQALPRCKKQSTTDSILHKYSRVTKSLAVESHEKMYS